MGEYFSVKNSVAIGGAIYRPTVCYKVTETLRGAVKSLAEQGKASFYDEEVRFVSGAPIRKRIEVKTESAAVKETGNTAPAKKRKVKRTFS